ncbi:uncharacterized protein KIAA1614 homolog isoform X3 [Coturnix japonica]|uniref:uncharacterized protein KIAA1614 homolog isoform X3 n=1 Tax=Coturnix japonica TaxID=93934 RepID=UPI0013A5D5F6|nr:uncharacterized protein KIAA1614 homolog isoform X3 [Coturnix japonica]
MRAMLMGCSSTAGFAGGERCREAPSGAQGWGVTLSGCMEGRGVPALCLHNPRADLAPPWAHRVPAVPWAACDRGGPVAASSSAVSVCRAWLGAANGRRRRRKRGRPGGRQGRPQPAAQPSGGAPAGLEGPRFAASFIFFFSFPPFASFPSSAFLLPPSRPAPDARGHMEGLRPSEPPRGPHAVLEGKVKALKEKRCAERPAPKKPRGRRGKVGAEEPRAQLRTYLTDGLLDGAAQWGEQGGLGGSPGLVSSGKEVTAGPEPLSLAERVERNRRLLHEVLGMHEVTASDGDWDSGVSLQDAEGCRAFVPGQELELSPRHEQAKQLLQRARMKARTNPLRASHDLLLLPREPSGTARPGVSTREAEGPAGGSLSDSSSGESGCREPRRPRGPSPSRVRFEDESARDAEVRYLERLRHRRALGSALEPRGQHGDGPVKPRAADSPAGGKCQACGSLLGAAVPAEGSPAARGRERTGPGAAAQPEPKARPLGPGGSPLWILPSRQRIHTEKIKETYIGSVARGDEADSALESTDTSDGCRTDSEEPRPRSPHPRGHREPRARGHRSPRTPTPKEKGASVAGGSGTLCPPAAGTAGGQDGGHGSETAGNGEPAAPSSKLAGPSHSPSTTTTKTCSQVPCRTSIPASSRQCPEPDAGSTLPQPKGAGQQRGPCGPVWLPGSPLRALSTNNCNNTRGQGSGSRSQLGAQHGETSRTDKAQHDGSTTLGEPARPTSRKGSGDAASSGLKRLLCSLSQSTKQRLGRFRCYSMEQLPGPAHSGHSVKRSPSLQALVSPFRQPQKAASMHSLLGRAPRASAYLLPQPGHGDRRPRDGSTR